MEFIKTMAVLLTGLGLFFIGVRSLAANLVPLVGRRERGAFVAALRGPFSAAISGTVAGLVTQSSTAVSWIVLGFVRARVLSDGPALLAPTWSNVGAALLPLLVAVNTASWAGFLIGLVGFAIYFRVGRTDRQHHMLEALLGAALLLFGLNLVSGIAAPLRQMLLENDALAAAMQNPWLLAAIGAGLSLAAQSSSVAAALAVTAVSSGLLTLPAALPLIAGANAASSVNNLMRLSGETTSGRTVFALQAAQKAAGSLVLVLVLVVSVYWPADGATTAQFGHNGGGQVAVLFAIAQVAGALVTSVMTRPVASLLRRLPPPRAVGALAQPAFLLPEALTDPPTALDLAMRELARLTVRLPLLLDHVRAEPEPGSPAPAILCQAGIALAGSIKSYLSSLLDNHPSRNEVAAALLLEAAVGDVGTLHETLAELAAIAPAAAALPTTGSLIEALHALISMVAEHAAGLGADDPDFVLSLLGDREGMMDDLRKRLAAASEARPEVQDALFRVTILFERAIWLERRLVTGMSQAQRTLAAA